LGEPPRLCVNQTSSSRMQLQKYSYFGVNILRSEHLSLADQFAGWGGQKGADRYSGAKWVALTGDGAAILENALAGFNCAVEEVLSRFGHAIIIDRVRAIAIRADGHRLLYWHGGYQQIVQKQTT
jgi:flavin reductase (DIM6/NTAB) family NADH-FMN oxidoreductase RutF